MTSLAIAAIATVSLEYLVQVHKVALSSDERREIRMYPVGTITQRIPHDRMVLRKRVAKKLFHQMAKIGELAKVMEVYRDFPEWWKFWVCRQEIPCRTYHLPVDWNMIPSTRVDIARIRVLTPFSELDEVSDWTDEQYEMIMRSNDAKYYLDPCMFITRCPSEYWQSSTHQSSTHQHQHQTYFRSQYQTQPH